MEKLHIIPHQHAVDREHRQQLHGHKGLLIWFVGLSGSGKSTLASALEAELFNKGVSTYILDGDNVRAGLNADLTFSAEDRKENIRRIAEVGKLMLDAGLVVLTAFISPFEEEREKAKAIIGADRFVEVFVDCPLEECERRDVKGLYAKARAGEISNFTGISSPFEAPTSPDIHIKTSESTPTQGVAELLNFIEKKIQL